MCPHCRKEIDVEPSRFLYLVFECPHCFRQVNSDPWLDKPLDKDEIKKKRPNPKWLKLVAGGKNE